MAPNDDKKNPSKPTLPPHPIDNLLINNTIQSLNYDSDQDKILDVVGDADEQSKNHSSDDSSKPAPSKRARRPKHAGRSSSLDNNRLG
jgi:hypothetical protein